MFKGHEMQGTGNAHNVRNAPTDGRDSNRDGKSVSILFVRIFKRVVQWLNAQASGGSADAAFELHVRAQPVLVLVRDANRVSTQRASIARQVKV